MPFNVRFSLQRWRKSEVIQENKRNRRTQKKGRRCHVRGPIYKQTKHLQRNFFLLLAWPSDFTYMATVKSLIHLLFISRVLVDIEQELRSPPAPPFEQKEYYYTCERLILPINYMTYKTS